MARKAYGFTIVELLIVIVVIAILAAVSIVSYAGIQKRAQTAQYVSAADTAEKQIRMAITTGQLNSVPIGATFCVGAPADFPAVTGKFAAGQCVVSDDPDYEPTVADTTIATQLSSAGITTPKGLPIVTQAGDGYTLHSRGLLVMKQGESSYLAAWYSPDASTCGRAGDFVRYVINMLRDMYPEETLISIYGENWEAEIRADYANVPPVCYLTIQQ